MPAGFAEILWILNNILIFLRIVFLQLIFNQFANLFTHIKIPLDTEFYGKNGIRFIIFFVVGGPDETGLNGGVFPAEPPAPVRTEHAEHGFSCL